MSSLRLLLEEIRYRKVNFVLAVLAVTVTVSLAVAAPTLIEGYRQQTEGVLARMEDETRKLMLKMGFNLMIVHEETNMADLWASDYAAVDMPQEYIGRLAESPELSLVRHLVATLQQKIKWRDRTALLVGYLPEVTQTHFGGKKPMGYVLPAGEVYLGHELGQGIEPGATIEIEGQSFKVAKVLDEKGSKEDITVAMNLADAQQVLGKPGVVNQIMALGCECQGERLPQIRAQLAKVLPDTKITEFNSIAVARAEQREMVAEEAAAVQGMLERLAGRATPLLIAACAVWVGLLALLNVRERRSEIGLLRALGKGSASIVTLFLGKAMLVGLIGGALGVAVGAWLASSAGAAVAGMGPDAVQAAAASFRPQAAMLLAALLGAPLLCMVASYLPTVLAVVQNPAAVLREA